MLGLELFPKQEGWCHVALGLQAASSTIRPGKFMPCRPASWRREELAVLPQGQGDAYRLLALDCSEIAVELCDATGNCLEAARLAERRQVHAAFCQGVAMIVRIHARCLST